MMSCKAQTAKSGDRMVEFDKQPDACPVCHRGIGPVWTTCAFLVNEGGRDASLEIVFRCPIEQCGHFFVGRYRDTHGPYSPGLSLVSCVPWEMRDLKFSETVGGWPGQRPFPNQESGAPFKRSLSGNFRW